VIITPPHRNDTLLNMLAKALKGFSSTNISTCERGMIEPVLLKISPGTPYKAKLDGVAVVAVDPQTHLALVRSVAIVKKGTVRRGKILHIESVVLNSTVDLNAALNIRARTAVNQLMVSESAAAQAA
jgi:hypothetical protein